MFFFCTEYLFQNVLTMAINKTFHFKVLPSQQVFDERESIHTKKTTNNNNQTHRTTIIFIIIRVYLTNFKRFINNVLNALFLTEKTINLNCL